MSDERRRGDDAVDAMLRDRRPRRFDATSDEMRVLETAARLRAARPGADLPSERFVADLEERLRQQAGERPAAARRLSRRALLSGAGAVAAAAAVGAAAGRLTQHDDPPALSRGASLLPSQTGHWVGVADRSAVTVGAILPFEAGPVRGFLVGGAADRVDAVSGVCTHMGCLLRPNVPAGRLDCPCHGASFALDGAPANSYVAAPLPRVPTRISGGRIEVYVAAT